jgi:arsenate reductase
MSKKAVLFLCTANSARSQMAEAFLRKYAGDRFEAHSAGLEPTEVHPLTVQVMREAGIDMAGHHAKSLSRFLGKLTVHYAVFLCDRAERACPFVWPSAIAHLSWPFDDPAAGEGSEEEKLARFRSVRDQIEQRIKGWLAETLPPAGTGG